MLHCVKLDLSLGSFETSPEFIDVPELLSVQHHSSQSPRPSPLGIQVDQQMMEFLALHGHMGA